jgi:hypothetical protein
MRVQQFVDEGLGNSAHLLIADRGGVAALIDPLRDAERASASRMSSRRTSTTIS